jgi:hypothetical protein
MQRVMASRSTLKPALEKSEPARLHHRMPIIPPSNPVTFWADLS